MNKIKSIRVPSIILVDIGNTSTQVALERGESFILVKRITSSGQTGRKVKTFLNAYARKGGISGAILCSVVPGLDKIWMNELKKVVRGKVLRINHKLNLGIKINYPDPGAIGADRLANSVAAHEKYGAPVIVADFGTALTFDFVGAEGAYEGGIIVPGPMLSAEYLAEKTALLPRLSFATIRKTMLAKGKPPVIGKNTNRAMLIGFRLGYIGMVKEIVSRLKHEKGLKNTRLCATGGYAEVILADSDLGIDIDPLLTLRGISRIYWLNS